MARVLLTGATGFLGRRVLPRLAACGHATRTWGRRAAISVDHIDGDITDAAACRRALAGIDVVVHLAALTGRGRTADFARINVGGTQLLVREADRAGVRRILYCSTIAVTFGDLDTYPYAHSKRAAELLVAQSGLAYTTVRPTIIGGTGSPVLSKLTALARLAVVPLFAGGVARLEPVHVDDVARMVVDLVNRDRFGGDIIEVGGGQVVTIRALLERLRAEHGLGPARFLTVPMGLAAPLARVGEALVGPAWPLAMGQLATFRFDGVARMPPDISALLGPMITLDQILREAVHP